MSAQSSAYARALWPLILLVLPFGAVYSLLSWFLADALIASGAMRGLLQYYHRPEDLFLLNSVLLGWASAAAAERRIDATSSGLALIAVSVCLIAISGGFGLAAVLVSPPPGVARELVVYCAICAGGAAVARANLGDYL